MEGQEFVHKPVLLYETVGSLNIKPGGCYVDGTLGGGGHAYEVCKRLGSGRLIGIDQDGDAIRAAGERLAPFADKVTIVRSNYENIKEILNDLQIKKVDGIYLDLGFPPTSLTPRPEDLLTGKTPPWICVWMTGRTALRQILSIPMTRENCTASYGITGRTASRKTLQSIL